MKIYLAGPINGCTDDEAHGWRDTLKSLYPDVTFLDPMARDYRGRENEPGIDAKIVEGDKQDIQNADVCLFYYEKPSVGTSMELFYARSLGKPTVIVNKSDKPLSPWLTYHATYITPHLNNAMFMVVKFGEAVTFPFEPIRVQS